MELTKPNIPLAERLRPTSLDNYFGQSHLVGENGPLFKAIKYKSIPSMIFWGPPGVGKTTLANIISQQLNKQFYTLSAIHSGVKDVREVIDKVQKQGMFSADGAILFIDEIHRFSKSQQDSLLGAVEKGIVTLIGATTENPSFEVIPALLSRCQVYVLKELTKEELIKLINHALANDEWLKSKKVVIKEHEALLAYSGGDGRKLLNLLELVVDQNDKSEITNEIVKSIIQHKAAKYDKTGEQHFDIISAFIKSVRGSDPNGALYWLARMIEGGEDPTFIARRLIILASEDIGNANPTALIMATNCFDAIKNIGMPEGRILLSQCTVYLSTSAKSNASYLAIDKALAEVRSSGDLNIPLHLRNAPTKLMKELDYGKGYKYSHDYPSNFVDQEYLPEEISGKVFYDPGKNKREEDIRNFLQNRWKNKYGY